MQDGSYIACDEQGAVYRLKHDDPKPEEKIHDDLVAFLRDYSGDRSELDHYFA